MAIFLVLQGYTDWCGGGTIKDGDTVYLNDLKCTPRVVTNHKGMLEVGLPVRREQTHAVIPIRFLQFVR